MSRPHSTPETCPPNPERGKGIRQRFRTLIFYCLLASFLFLGILLLVFRDLGLFMVVLTANPLLFILALYLVSAAIASVLTYFVSRQILYPVECLSKASKKVAGRDFDVSLSPDTNLEELDTLIRNFNDMVRELSSIETLREDFIANVSHEFKTPLSGIEGYATLLSEKDLTEEERMEYARRILDSARRLSRLTGNILLLSKLENGSVRAEITHYRLDEQIRTAILDLSTLWEPMEIDWQLDLPEIEFYGPEGFYHEVWINLIGNACKYSFRGGTVEIALQKCVGGVEAKITDHGIGMSEETRDHLFEKFYQADTSRKSDGNGLGLSLCQKIMSLTGGHISVESKEGEGSTFTVFFCEIVKEHDA